MAITTVNAFYGVGAAEGGTSTIVAPAFSGQILAALAGGPMSSDLEGFCLPVHDAGASTSYTLNWIDGTQTLLYPPSNVIMFRNDPPAWTASTQYPVNAIVLGSGHVQQVTVAGKSSTSAPSWSTSGGTVVDGSITWKDLGAINPAGTGYPISVTAITNVSATVTLASAGTSTDVSVHAFRIIR